jgi:hypothetical protein
MTAEQFVYWLQGYIEINDPVNITSRETQIIKDHLKLVFEKQTPNRLTTVPDTGITNTPYPGPFTTNPCTVPNTTKTWEWDRINNPFTVTCTDDNPFNDKFNSLINDKKLC